ncbi:unnamed protein product, partial [Prorocentrum cordatum]
SHCCGSSGCRYRPAAYSRAPPLRGPGGTMQRLARGLLGLATLAGRTEAARLDRHGSGATPIGKVLELLAKLDSQLVKDGEEADKAHAEYQDWCKFGKKDDLEYQKKTSTSEIDELTATIEKSKSDVVSETTRRRRDRGARLRHRAGRGRPQGRHHHPRQRERGVRGCRDGAGRRHRYPGQGHQHAGAEAEDLRARAAHHRHPQHRVADQGPTGCHRGCRAATARRAEADGPGAEPCRRRGPDGSDEDPMGAPAAKAYESHSSNIVEVLEDMRAKAEAQLDEVRKQETGAHHSYELTAQSLRDQAAADTKEPSSARPSPRRPWRRRPAPPPRATCRLPKRPWTPPRRSSRR